MFVDHETVRAPALKRNGVSPIQIHLAQLDGGVWIYSLTIQVAESVSTASPSMREFTTTYPTRGQTIRAAVSEITRLMHRPSSSKAKEAATIHSWLDKLYAMPDSDWTEELAISESAKSTEIVSKARWPSLLMSADQAGLLKMTVAGAAIERKHHEDIAELVRVCERRITVAGYDMPVANLSYTMSSDASALMARDEPFAACYWDSAESRVFSLRSKDGGLDVTALAQQYGGAVIPMQPVSTFPAITNSPAPEGPAL